MKFVQAANYTPCLDLPRRRVELVVLHSMENQERPTAAETVADWFAGPTAPQASAHFCVDEDSAVQCVRLQDVAWAAPSANRTGVHIEHAGYARQTVSEWLDDAGTKMLQRSARICAYVLRLYDLPAVFLQPSGIKGGSGITSHANVSVAYQTPGGHTDPGPNFPVGLYLDLVAKYGSLADPLGDLAPVV